MKGFYSIDPLINESNIKKTVYTKNGNQIPYTMLNYDKSISININNMEVRKYRSVIVYNDAITSSVVSFSPPKSLHLSEFLKNYVDEGKKFICNEIIEGSMINLWYNEINESWEISTKKVIGGKNFTILKCRLLC